MIAFAVLKCSFESVCVCGKWKFQDFIQSLEVEIRNTVTQVHQKTLNLSQIIHIHTSEAVAFWRDS